MKIKKSQHGFTLIEVMITVGLVSIFVPTILLMVLFLTRSINSGIEHNISLSKSRHFQQVFSRYINASQKKLILVGSSANGILFTQYDEAAKQWVPAALEYNETQANIVYSPDLATTNGQKILLTEAYPYTPHSSVFSVSNGSATCALLIGKRKRVEMEVSATPRNK